MRTDASAMLVSFPRRHEVPSEGKQVSPRHERYLLSSVCFPSLLHGFIFQIEGGVPSMCTSWSSLGTVNMILCTAKAYTGGSVTVGIPSGERSPLKYSSLLSVE